MIELLHVNPNSADPIYKQLHDQIVRLIVGGQIKAGDALPSVRKMAEHFAVNPMTISRAISLLVDQGFLERRRGQPTRVAQQTEKENLQSERIIKTSVKKLVQEAKELGIECGTLVELIKSSWEQ